MVDSFINTSWMTANIASSKEGSRSTSNRGEHMNTCNLGIEFFKLFYELAITEATKAQTFEA